MSYGILFCSRYLVSCLSGCLLSVAIDDAAAVGPDVNASEDARIASDGSFTSASPLMLIVVYAHPRLTCIDRPEDATHSCDLRCRVERCRSNVGAHKRRS